MGPIQIDWARLAAPAAPIAIRGTSPGPTQWPLPPPRRQIAEDSCNMDWGWPGNSKIAYMHNRSEKWLVRNECRSEIGPKTTRETRWGLHRPKNGPGTAQNLPKNEPGTSILHLSNVPLPGNHSTPPICRAPKRVLSSRRLEPTPGAGFPTPGPDIGPGGRKTGTGAL